MALRFSNYCLVDENGKTFFVSYEKLREECLKNSFCNLSISKIIFEAVAVVTGERIIRTNGYSNSLLYQWLEKSIWNDNRYQEEKNLREKIFHNKKEASAEQRIYELEEFYYLKNRKRQVKKY